MRTRVRRAAAGVAAAVVLGVASPASAQATVSHSAAGDLFDVQTGIQLFALDARSGPSGEGPTGTVSWHVGGGLGPSWNASVTCLAVSASTAVIGFSGTMSFSGMASPVVGLIRVADGGGPASALDSFEWAETRGPPGGGPIPGPTDCSSYPSIFARGGGPAVNRAGDIVVVDAQPVDQDDGEDDNGEDDDSGEKDDDGEEDQNGADEDGASAAAWPDSMAAIGDSWSAAFNAHPDDAVVPSPVQSPPDLSACPNGRGPFGDPTSVGLPAAYGLDCPRNSWSTGTNPQVNSVYRRILAHNPAIAGHVANWATTAVSVSDLARQAALAATQGAELVTVNIGINDACAPLGSNGGQQTPLNTFRTQFERALTILAAAPAHPVILVASIQNAFRTWRLFHDDPNAQVRWELGVICPPLLTNPTSTAPADVARRAAFLGRLAAYNLIEARVCSKTPRCQTDGGALFAWHFDRDAIATVTNTGGVNAFPFDLPVLAPVGPGAIPNSTGDYWHPTVRGQATLAARVWNTAKLGD